MTETTPINPRLLLKLEGGVVALLSGLAYRWNHGTWILFGVLFLVPDLSMIGYLANARWGAATYNTIHTYVVPLLLTAYGAATGQRTIFLLSLIWIAHIGFDRLLGFGLKYPTRFKDTHLDPERHVVT